MTKLQEQTALKQLFGFCAIFLLAVLILMTITLKSELNDKQSELDSKPRPHGTLIYQNEHLELYQK